MIEKNKIIRDLNEIKYYYTHKEFFDNSFSITGNNKVLQTIERYNQAICGADQKIHELFVLMYIQGLSWEVVAATKPCSMDYIFRHHRKLLKFFQENVAEAA